MSAHLRNALDELVDRCEGERGNWADVVGRAGASRTRRRRYSVLAIALLTLTLALLVTPAFGLRNAVLGLIGRENVEFGEGEQAPKLVRRQFEDLGLGAPPGMDPRALSLQTRRVGTFKLRGKSRALWVAPTERGGFCYTLEQAAGGCLRNEPFPAGRVAVTYQAGARPGQPVEAGPIQGWTLDRDAARIIVEFEDATSVAVPFTYVSAPIDAGFFLYDLPTEHRREPHRPSAVVVRNADGDELAREPIRYEGPSPRERLTAPSPPQQLPAQPAGPPSAPVQRATAKGVTVTAGANGSVVFDATGADPATAALNGSRASYVCFRFREGSARGYGISGSYRTKAGFRYFGVGTPFDGCEIQGSYGHRWPDRLGSHSAVEFAFTPAAERYFVDRAAARDLALFVRARKVQEIRRKTGPDVAAELESVFGATIDRLSSSDARAEVGRVGYWPGRDRTLFREVSPTGRVFEVEVVEGKIARENLGDLAMVF